MPGGGLLQLEEAHVEGGIVRDQHRVLAKTLELRQDFAYGRLARQRLRLDAVNARGGLADRALRIDELLEHFVLEQPGVDDAHRAEADDLVAGGGFKPRGFGVENRIVEIDQPPIGKALHRIRVAKQIEVVVLGPALRAETAPRRRRGRRPERQQQPEPGRMRGLVRLHPDFAAVALEHVLQGQGRLLGADLHRLGFPQRERVAGHDRPAPDQIQFGKAAVFAARRPIERTP